jgi:hypothetical protein
MPRGRPKGTGYKRTIKRVLGDLYLVREVRWAQNERSLTLPEAKSRIAAFHKMSVRELERAMTRTKKSLGLAPGARLFRGRPPNVEVSE